MNKLELHTEDKQYNLLIRQGNTIDKPEDIVKDTYVLDFLNIPEAKPSESALEDALWEEKELEGKALNIV
jgi:predicted nuclease of restriction endonuclease-like (RecB) superfamily